MKHSTIYAILLGACACVGNLADAQTFTTLYNFCVGRCRYGTDPNESLVQGVDGNLYGTTYLGGSGGSGTVFKITPAGTLTRVRSFCRVGGCADGEFPASGLVLANNGDFFGVTTAGGATVGGGTVFKIASSGKFTTLYNFCVQSGCPDGASPRTALIEAEDVNLYGTTPEGGMNNYGTAFKITRGGELTTLHSFCAESGCVEGGSPEGALVQAKDGNLYGTTAVGGANNGGTVFSMSKEGIVTTVYSFCRTSECRDGQEPQAALLLATNGDLYGTTTSGGIYNGGTVFKIAPSGKFTRLYSFCALSETGCPDGNLPVGGLVQATDGNLYGTTARGGSNNDGTVFKITPSGALTTLFSFDGAFYGGITVQATDGNLYGVSSEGGAHGGGQVFSLSVGLGPFVKLLPTFGKAGAPVTLLGTDLAGATSVAFDGVAANVTVISATEIKTVVPPGATTGVVEVTTPSGTLLSNVAFHVHE